MSLQSLLKHGGGPGPYGQSVKAKVCAAASPISYTGQDGTNKQAMTVGLCDGHQTIRLVCYDQAKFQRLRVDNVVVLREVIVKTEETPAFLVATRATKIFLAGGVDVTNAQRQACEAIVNPPAAPVVTIAEALASPVKKRNSVKGRIIQEEQARTVTTKTGEVVVKKITIEDSTSKSQVSLWRDVSEVDCHTNDYVEITDVTVNVYNNITSLSTTGRTTMKKCTEPVISSSGKVEAVSEEGNNAELLLTNNNILTVPLTMLSNAIGNNRPVEELTASGPVDITYTQRGNDVLSITIVRPAE